MKTKNVVLAITGASGVIYAVRLLEVLTAAGCDVYLSISPSAQKVLKQELDLTHRPGRLLAFQPAAQPRKHFG